MHKSNKVSKENFTFSPRKLISPLIIFAIFAIFTFKTTEGRAINKFSFQPNFPLGQYQIEEWQLRGAASSLGHVIRLTGEREGKEVGRGGGSPPTRAQHSLLLNPLPLHRECYFELSIDFSVHFDEEKEGGREGGFAIWLTSKVAEFGPNFGGPQRWEGIAITFDSEIETIELHRSDGRKILGEETYEGGCHFPFRQSPSYFSYDFSSFYLFLEHDLLHMFVTNEGGEWKECLLKHQIQFLDQYFVSISAASSSLALKQDIKKLSINIAEDLSTEEENFNRPPLQTIAPLITHRLDDFVSAIIERNEDDEDLAIEVEELNDWFDSQFESLKVTIGGQIVEINFGLDQLLSSSTELSKQIDIIKEMSGELEKQFENVEKSAEDFLNNNQNQNYEPLRILQSDLNLLFESSTNISNTINVIQQSQNKQRSKNKEIKNKILKTIEGYLLYAVTGIVSFAVLLFIIKKLSSMTKSNSNSKSKSKFAPHWAA